MIDPIGANPFIYSFAALNPAQAVTQLPDVNPADRARFLEALSAPKDTSSAPNIAAADFQTLEPTPPAFGDAILEGLNKMRSGFQELSSQVEAATRKSVTLTPPELLDLQMQISKITLTAQLAGQAASKVEQDINTLLKSS